MTIYENVKRDDKTQLNPPNSTTIKRNNIVLITVIIIRTYCSMNIIFITL